MDKPEDRYLCLIWFVILLSGCKTENTGEDCYVDFTVAMSAEQSQSVLDQAMIAAGVPYLWGGQDMKGFDCSGLMLWAADRAGITSYWQDASGRAVTDVSADTLFRYNSTPVACSDLRFGDVIFFDADADGVIEHSSFFVSAGSTVEAGPVVFDAYSVSGQVEQRIVSDFWLKSPYFARLHKTYVECVAN